MSSQSSQSFDDILNYCLDHMHLGGTVSECLEKFPAWKEELLPILEITSLISQTQYEPISEQASLAGEANMLKALEEEKLNQKAVYPLASFFAPVRFLYQILFSEETHPMTRVTRTAFASLLLAFSFFFTLNASADSLPGDMLYPIKTLGQQARLQLAAPEQKSAVISQITATRIAELDALLNDNGRVATVTLDGPVTIIDDNTIMVEGFEIELTAETIQHIEFSDGDVIEITIQLSDGTLSAIEIDKSDLEKDDTINRSGFGNDNENTNEAVETITPVPTIENTAVPEPTETAPASAYPTPAPDNGSGSNDSDNQNGNCLLYTSPSPRDS